MNYFSIFLVLLLSCSTSHAQTYIQGNNLIEVPVTTATAASTTTLTAASKKQQQFTGSTTQNIALPDATTLQKGRTFYISNRSSGTLTIKYNDATTALTLIGGNQAYFVLEANGSTNGTWDIGATQVPLIATAPLVISGTALTCNVASGSQPGCLASADWTAFNNKQAGPLTGDVTTSGAVATLATVNGNVGSFGSSTAIPAVTVNAKGLVTAASTSVVIAPAGTLSGTTLNATVVTSSLTSVGTIATGVWQGTAVGSQYGGTGIDSHSSTGYPSIAAGTWSVATAANTFISLFETVATSVGDLLYGGTSGTPTRLANGTTGQVLMATTSSAPSWQTAQGNATIFKAPTAQTFTATGSTTGYLFFVSSANASAGSTYTNNGNTYVVLNTIAAGTQLFTSQASAPLASGTLTKASGTGDATITFSSNKALATYTVPTSPAPLYIRVRLVGGAGGGASSGTSGTGAGAIGNNSYFGSNLIFANAGTGGGDQTSGGAGGTAGLGTGPVGIAVTGGAGSTPGITGGAVANTGDYGGGVGGVSPFGGAGAGSFTNGGAAVANTGSGGQGGGNNGAQTAAHVGSGGGAGGYVDAIIASPASSYPYIIGTGGAGATGSNNANGGNGAAGILIIEEHYQ